MGMSDMSCTRRVVPGAATKPNAASEVPEAGSSRREESERLPAETVSVPSEEAMRHMLGPEWRSSPASMVADAAGDAEPCGVASMRRAGADEIGPGCSTGMTVTHRRPV